MSVERDVIDLRDYQRSRFTFHYPEMFEPVARHWLVQTIVPENALGVVFGPSGCGKSTMLTALACSLATGKDFLGKPTKQRGVIYVGCEDADGIKYRREGWIVANSADRRSMPFAIISEAPDLWREDDPSCPTDTDLLIEAIKGQQAAQSERGAPTGLIVLDTSRKAFPGMEENDSGDADRMCRTARRIMAECGATVLMASHVALGRNGEDPRGSSGYVGDVDFALGLKREGRDRQVWVRKMRNGADADGNPALRWNYELQPMKLGFEGEDGDEESVAVFCVADEPPPMSGAKPSLSRTESILIKAVRELVSAGEGVPPPPDLNGHTNAAFVHVSKVRERAASLGISKSGSGPDAIRKAVDRAKSSLIQKRQLAACGDDFVGLVSCPDKRTFPDMSPLVR